MIIAKRPRRYAPNRAAEGITTCLANTPVFQNVAVHLSSLCVSASSRHKQSILGAIAIYAIVAVQADAKTSMHARVASGRAGKVISRMLYDRCLHALLPVA